MTRIDIIAAGVFILALFLVLAFATSLIESDSFCSRVQITFEAK